MQKCNTCNPHKLGTGHNFTKSAKVESKTTGFYPNVTDYVTYLRSGLC